MHTLVSVLFFDAVFASKGYPFKNIFNIFVATLHFSSEWLQWLMANDRVIPELYTCVGTVLKHRLTGFSPNGHHNIY